MGTKRMYMDIRRGASQPSSLSANNFDAISDNNRRVTKSPNDAENIKMSYNNILNTLPLFNVFCSEYNLLKRGKFVYRL